MKDIPRNLTRDSFCRSRVESCTRAYVVFDWMANLAIDAAGGGKKVFGSKPDVADYRDTDLTTEAGRAARGNLANMPDIMALLEKILPGYGEMVAQGSKNTLSLLKGEIPKDVQAAIQRSSAFKSLQGGYGGSSMARALTARDLGRTSLDLTEMGGNAAQRWAGLTQAGVAPFTVTAPAQGAATFQNNLYRQATEQHRYNVAASPDPAAAGLFNTIATIGGTAASFGLGAMGGAMGGSGGQRQPAPATQPQYPYQSPYGNLASNWNWGSYGG